MELLLTQDQQMVQDSAMRLCKDFGGPHRMRAMAEDGLKLDAPAWQQVTRAEWPSLVVPAEQGGHGMGLFGLALVMEAAGQSLLHVPLAEASAVRFLLTAARPCALFERLQDPSAIVLPCWIDTQDAYARDMRWPAVEGAGDGLALTGTLQGLRFNGSADAYVVPAMNGEEQLLVQVDARNASVRAQPATHIDDVRSDVVSIERLAVRESDVIARGEEARSLYRAMGDILQVGTSAALLGLARSAHAMTLDHLRTRRQFGKPLAAFQALQHKCVDAFLDLELNRSLLFRVAAAWDQRQHHPAMLAALKARASKSALAVTRLGLQMHGAMGYTQQHDIGLFHRRALALAALYGNDNHHSHRFSELTWPRRGTA
jgi:alkylation response protein AidB-like acyl-CoA dehydrogenase